MKKTADDLEAVRDLVTILEPFSDEDRDRIIRWAREKLGMPVGMLPRAEDLGKPATTPDTSVPARPPESRPQDIRSFITEKGPKTDLQLAAVVAYYYQFVAPDEERKDAIKAKDLTEACRKADWHRPGAPGQVLVNSCNSGLLDRVDPGSYRINSVGENLVAMVLPGGEEAPSSGGRVKAKRKKKRAKPARSSTRRKKSKKTAQKKAPGTGKRHRSR